MSQAIIQVEGVGKLYRLRHAASKHDTFRDVLTGALTYPWRRLKGLGEPIANNESFWALKDINFQVRQGEVIGFIGRNGAGKSTLLKVLSRITEPTEGVIRMRGRVASLLEVGTGFHPELSGRENIYLNGSILGMKKREIDQKFDAIVDFSGVEKFLDTPVKYYSSGMYVRLAFAVAAHLEPEILIVDEVLAVGDAEFQKKCLGKMQQVASGEGRTVLFVSHNMSAVRQLCDRVIWLDQGKLLMEDKVETVVGAYLSAGGKSTFQAVQSSHGVELIEAQLLEAAGDKPTQHAVFNQDYRLRVTANFHKPIKDASFVLRLYDDMGGLVSTLCLPEEGVDPMLMSGTMRCQFNVPRLQLFPGAYSVSVLVFRPNEETPYLEAESALRFEVEPAIVRDGMWAYKRHHGLVRICDGAQVTCVEPAAAVK